MATKTLTSKMSFSTLSEVSSKMDFRRTWILLLLQLASSMILQEAGSQNVANTTRLAIITSDFQVDILEGQSGQLISSTSLTDLSGHPYGIGLTGNRIRILSLNKNKKFFISDLTPNTLKLISSHELATDKGPFQKIQSIWFTTDKTFIYDETLQTIFFASDNDDTFTSLIRADERITSLDYDSCQNQLYWSTESAIQRLSLDSNEVEILVDDLKSLRALSIDQHTRNVYWLVANDQVRHKNSFRLERSDLNGENRRVICMTSSTQEVLVRKMIVDEENVYFADWKNRIVWKMKKNGNEDQECNLVRLDSSSTLKPVDLSSHDPQLELCSVQNKTGDSLDLVMTSQTNIPLTTQSVPKEGPCHNYCLHSEDQTTSISCHVNSLGIPVCGCPPGFEGSRCQINMCTNFCLNGGTCRIESEKAVCRCKNNFTGDRCHLPLSENSSKEVNLPTSFVSNNTNAKSCSYFFAFIACLISSAILAVTLISVVVCIAFRRRRESALPPPIMTANIVKKSPSRSRVFSSSRDKSLSRAQSSIHDVMTSSSASQPVTCPNGVILDLEDCCQMTLCDQPCAEAIFRKPTHRKNRGVVNGSSKDIGGDTDALLDNETLS